MFKPLRHCLLQETYRDIQVDIWGKSSQNWNCFESVLWEHFRHYSLHQFLAFQKSKIHKSPRPTHDNRDKARGNFIKSKLNSFGRAIRERLITPNALSSDIFFKTKQNGTLLKQRRRQPSTLASKT